MVGIGGNDHELHQSKSIESKTNPALQPFAFAVDIGEIEKADFEQADS